MLKVTFDTNVVPANEFQRTMLANAMCDKPIEIGLVTVSERELEGSSITVSFQPILETMVWDESHFGKSVWNADPIKEDAIIGESRIGSCLIAASQFDFESILKVMSNGSFPKQGLRNKLYPGQKRLLRDAMILQAHVREKRDILVSNDAKAFGRVGKSLRNKLENMLDTRIMSLDEFLEHIKTIPGQE